MYRYGQIMSIQGALFCACCRPRVDVGVGTFNSSQMNMNKGQCDPMW